MELSRKARYGLRALCHVASVGHSSAQNIANRQGIPSRYLEEIIAQLRRAGFVVGKRGPRGGYRLARPASEIYVGEIIAALSRPAPGTNTPQDEITRLVESRVDASFRDVMYRLPLADLLGDAREEHRRSATNYVI
jgi:Rrf2 family protein